jgi:hypothetical protein
MHGLGGHGFKMPMVLCKYYSRYINILRPNYIHTAVVQVSSHTIHCNIGYTGIYHSLQSLRKLLYMHLSSAGQQRAVAHVAPEKHAAAPYL